MKSEYISSATDDSIVLIYPYSIDYAVVIYQDFVGKCIKITLDNLEDETRETVYLDDDKKLH
jgi:hypothetical protein